MTQTQKTELGVTDPALHRKVTNAQPDTVADHQELAQCARPVQCSRCAAHHTAPCSACHYCMAMHTEAHSKTLT